MRRLLAALLLAGGAHAFAADCQLVAKGYGPKGQAQVRLETVVSGLEVPWGIAFLPGGDALVTERPGRVRLVHALAAKKPAPLRPEVVASIAVDATEEGGLLGIALGPQFDENRFFYLYMTVREGGKKSNRVERWQLARDFASAKFDKRIVDGIPSAAYHDGGRIRFGPDGMLYVGTGDGREPDRSQDPKSLGGKLLRFTADGAVPKDNPIAGNPMYVLGIRNTQGFDWKDGKLYLTDHGPSGEMLRTGHDEVNLASPGANLGWPTIYGCEKKAGMIAPSLTWTEAVPPGGASFYTGTGIPEWRGSLLIGTLRSQHLHRVKFSDADPAQVELHEVYFANEAGRLRDVVMGPDGFLYVTTSNCDGRGECGRDRDRILRVVPRQ
ncbi:MAG TPA: PQQ-dependent sugar dehydrogenase [Myxococcales bacterium]|nr:PQQ-dependent sugar dehydrogenase [Myxococcales bacterium]